MNFTAVGQHRQTIAPDKLPSNKETISKQRTPVANLTEQDLNTIIELHKQGKSIREISELVPQSKSTVGRILKKHIHEA